MSQIVDCEKTIRIHMETFSIKSVKLFARLVAIDTNEAGIIDVL